MTLDAARMNLANTFEPGMGYVALSRVKSLKDLSIVGLSSRAFFVHPEVSEKDKEFKKKSVLASAKFESLRANKEKREKKLAKKSADKTKKATEWAAKLAKMREAYPNAYMPWSKVDDANLERLFKKGKTVKELSEKFERHQGSIRKRLEKLLGEDYDSRA
jgi:hypothetical protein